MIMIEPKYLRRREAAEYIRKRYGFCTAKTLAKLAVIGGGPPMAKAGSIAIYPLDGLDLWAESKVIPASQAA
jgi:hypothetical protein